ncbi:MAG: phosphatase PAP2 family protein [Chloroflexota bacterium]|nr:phosphatase PAP2 family protein [Chloroflexota bacterium]
MDAIWQWGLDLIHTIQLVHGPALDTTFKAITFLGEEEFFLILLPLVVWCVDFTVGARLAFAFLLSSYANTGIKDIFAHPRPFELDATVQLHEASGYGLPSGHSQSAVVVWGVIAAGFRKTAAKAAAWLWVVAIALMALIGFSRIYLGVHFPTDVLGGWMVGAIFLAAYVALQPRVEAWLKRAGLGAQLALAVVVPLALLLLHPTKGAASPMATLMGMGVGFAFLRQVTSFSAAGPAWQIAVRFLVGMVGIGVLYFGLSAVFPHEGEPLYFALRFVRYALVGLWAGLGAPWLFLKLRLASTG